MRNFLIATSALAFAGGVAAVPASAADMLSLGVGGYMEQWFGYANRDDKGVDGGFDTQTDAEVHFRGSLESDSGLKFTVHVELEGANDSVNTVDADGKAGKTDETEIDEAFVRVTGSFGQIELGQRDPIHARTHYAAGFGAGIGLNAGDTQNWVPGVYLETAGWTTSGDNRNLIYISPRVNGVQVGLSYGPDSGNENSPGGAPKDNDSSVWAAGINFNETIGDMSFKVSLGHMNRSQTSSLSYNHDNADESATDATAKMMKGFEDRTFTNAGLQVGMGAFTFAASYATRDDGGYVVECLATVDGAANTAVPCTDPADGTGIRPATDHDGDTDTNAVDITGVRAIENEAHESDTWAIGITYSDGPVTLSIDHLNYERENGDERTATGLSAGYKLAPGVDWKTSVIGVEDDTSGAEGTAFVTGLDIHF